MKPIFHVGGLILATSLMATSAGISPAAAGMGVSPKIDPSAQAKAEAAYANLPLYFEANHGQTDASVKFLARGRGYSLFLTPSEAVLALDAPAASRAHGRDVVRLRLNGAKTDPIVQGRDRLPGHSNYLTGNDPQKWQTNVERYAKVAFQQVYPGIDVVYYGNQRQLEYDFVVAPGANPGRILMDFRGARRVALDPHGNLVLNLKGGRLAFGAPTIYQKTGETRERVEGRYVMAGRHQVRFEVGAYDTSKELVIDPSLMYSTYLGGTVEDRVNAITLDSLGNVYLAGLTVSGSFPGSAGGYQPAIAAGTDAFVTKITAAGAIAWSTYLGGNGIDIANAIGVDGLGIVHIAGATTSTNFPTASPYQATNAGGTDAFVTAINAAGTALVYSTYLGGAGVDDGYGLAVDAAGNVYVAGDTTSNATTFPQTPGAYQTTAGGASDAFVSKFSAAGAIGYSTFLGGTGLDRGRAIAIDGIGNAYVTGQAADAFPTVPVTAFKTTITGSFDVFVSKLDSTGAILLYSTYVGGSGIDDAFAIALDGTNPATLNIYITGYTFSADFPKIGFATVGQLTIGTAPDSYVFKLNMNGGGGSLDGVYSTYLGGSTDDRGTAIKVDTAGNVYVTGHTTSGDFPVVNPIQGTNVGTGMVFVTEIGPTGAARVFSTYLGGVTDQQGNGIALDSTRNIYVTGWTNSTDYPMATPFQAANAGSYDGFVTKIAAPSPSGSPPPPPPALPVVTSVAPSGGVQAGGTTVIIGGTGFTGVVGASGVKFGGTNAVSYTVDSDIQMTAVSPGHVSGIVHIVATNPVGSSSIGPDDEYTYFLGTSTTTLAPAITGLEPILGPSTGGTTVIITGSGLAGVTGANGVKFGELNAASYVVNSDVQITAKTKPHAVGVVDVVATSLVGASSKVPADRYTYFLTPPITGTVDCFDPYLFPSPAEGTTAGIVYCMSSGPGLVNIRVYNEVGDLVTELDERKPTGAQGSSLNVGKMAPGVYFYILNITFDDGTTKKYPKNKFVVLH